MKPMDKYKADVGENRGLRVACGATGLKTFFYRYISPVTGKLTQVKIGNFPQTTLAVARVKLHELKKIRNDGRCPAFETRTEKKKVVKTIAQGLTVRELVELYLKERIEDKITPDGRFIPGARKKKGQMEVRRTLQADVVTSLGDRIASGISRKEVVELINSVIDRGAKVQAGILLRELSSAYEFAIGLGHFNDDFYNPALLAKSSLRQTKIKLTSKRGTRVFNEKELTRFLHWLPSSSFSPVVKNVLRLTLLTGCRTGEVCNITWEDVDFETHTIHLRNTKNGLDRDVQLSVQAMKFLKNLNPTSERSLFPARITHLPIQQKSLTENTWRLRRDNKMINIHHWTPHDLRRTVRTGLSRLQCPNEVAEAVLGHTRGGIEGVYNLYRYDAECKKWLQVWADYLDSLMR